MQKMGESFPASNEGEGLTKTETKKVADVDVSLRDKLKGFVVRSKRQ